MAKRREFIVRADIEFRGATAIVMARSAEEALKMVDAGHFGEGMDTSTAELTNWKALNAEENF